MTDEVQPSRAVLAAEGLAVTLANMTDQVKDLRRDNKRNQFFIRCLAASLAFDLFLSVALGWIGFTAHDASTRASEASAVAVANQRNFCLAGNETRAAQVNLWNTVLSISPAEPGDEQRRADFRAYIAKTFAQRDCN